MPDPLDQIVRLLRPRAMFSKGISGAGRWAVRYDEFGHPGFCAVLEGRCLLAITGADPITLEAGDFVLLPATPAFTMSGFEPAVPRRIEPALEPSPQEEVRHGDADGPPDVRLRGGYFMFDSPDAHLAVSLLPAIVHIHGDARLATLVKLFGEEAGAQRPGRDLVLSRLVEVLLIESLRSAQGHGAQPGLLRGLADVRIAAALRAMHGDSERSWTVDEVAHEAGLSRSAFFERFTRIVGMRPMEYLVAWRMALAKDLLRSGKMALDEVARRVGYGSASTFSTAFSRHVGQSPGRFARAGDQADRPGSRPALAGW